MGIPPTHPTSGAAPEEVDRAVGRATVDDPDLHELRRIVLPDDVIEAALDVALLVEGRHHDVDRRPPCRRRPCHAGKHRSGAYAPLPILKCSCTWAAVSTVPE